LLRQTTQLAGVWMPKHAICSIKFTV